MGVIIRGVAGTIRFVDEQYNGKRRLLGKTAKKVSEDLLRKARDNAPVHEGTLQDSGNARVTDKGRGNGFFVEVGFDTPYALRMHEAHYRAHDPHDKGRDKTRQTLRFKRGGVTVTQVVQKRTIQGFWRDSRGNLHGRKYLTRAVDANMPKYKAAFEAIGDKR